MKYFTIFGLLLVTFLAYTSAQRCPGEPPNPICDRIRNVGRGGPGCTPRTMWYFNMRTRRCSQMRYLGCGGNDNRHCTLAACRQRCRG